MCKLYSSKQRLAVVEALQQYDQWEQILQRLNQCAPADAIPQAATSPVAFGELIIDVHRTELIAILEQRMRTIEQSLVPAGIALRAGLSVPDMPSEAAESLPSIRAAQAAQEDKA